MNAPTPVSIAILNHERAATLRRTLQLALAQDYPGLEVIVVDNASTDDSARMVEDEFPAARLIRLSENIGCAARNAGVAAARGDIVLTLDNDVFLTSPRAVGAVVALFAARPALACVDFKILDGTGALSRRDWCHPRDWRRFADEEFDTDYVLEGACAFRRDVFEAVGGYWAPFFLGHEGRDLALRLLDAGHTIGYAPSVAVRHLVSAEARPSARIYYTFTRNAIWVALRRHRPRAAARAILASCALMAFASLRAHEGAAFVRALRDAVAGARAARDTRRPLDPATYRRLRQIRALAPGVLEKVKRHWNERLI
jgi:GT2 family glycosyltransferase